MDLVRCAAAAPSPARSLARRGTKPATQRLQIRSSRGCRSSRAATTALSRAGLSLTRPPSSTRSRPSRRPAGQRTCHASKSTRSSPSSMSTSPSPSTRRARLPRPTSSSSSSSARRLTSSRAAEDKLTGRDLGRSGATTPMPDLFEFTAMFESAPFPDQPTPSSSAPRNAVATAAKSRAPPPPSRGPPRNPLPAAAPAPAPTRLQSLLSSVPLLPRLFPSLAAPSPLPANGTRRPPRKPSPYPQLKTGRRTILLAVVDNGTSSLLRFSEAEFAKLPWAGTARSA